MSRQSSPNVLLIHCHDLGRYLGCYGRDVNTPHIDALAEDGACFEQHFTTAPQCSPSRGSLHTGRYPHENGLMGLAHGAWELNDDEVPLPECLSVAGYETHLFGLQHITGQPAGLGYDRVHSENQLSPDVDPSVHAANRAAVVAETVAAFLSDPPTPFFASVGFFELHRVLNEETGQFGFEGERYDTPDPEAVDPVPYLPDVEGVRADLAEMHGMVRAVDDGVGVIREALADTGLQDDTMVLFTTEHGIAFPGAKGTLFDPGIEAALIWTAPDVIEADRRYDELVSNVDVLPTLLDLLDIPIPDRVSGRTFRPLLAGEAYEPRDAIYAEMSWHDRYNPTRCVRTRRHKYIRNFWHLPRVYMTKDCYLSRSGDAVHREFMFPDRAYEELYDLETDPHERTNVADTGSADHVRERLRERLEEWMDTTDDPLSDGPIPPADFEEIQRLR